jgi:tetratricopeptide (TPR) repeat protein
VSGNFSIKIPELCMLRCMLKIFAASLLAAASACAADVRDEEAAAEYGAALSLLQQQKFPEALPRFERLAQRSDRIGAMSRAALAQTYFELQRYDDAQAVLEKLLKDDPRDDRSRYLLARCHFRSQRYKEALPLFEEVAQAGSERAEPAKYFAAASLEGLGRTRKAQGAYRTVGRGTSDWAGSARDAASSLAGKPYRVTLDYLGGYDTGIVQTAAEGMPSGGKDFFNQIYAEIKGRVLNEEKADVWLSLEHYGLHYPELHNNDYFQDAAKVAVGIYDIAPFEKITVSHQLRYAQLDYQSYRKENRIEAAADYADSVHRIRFGVAYGDNDYFREASGLSGPDAMFFFDYRRPLPRWEHELRLRGNVDYRWPQTDEFERFTQRVRLQYRAKMAGKLYGMIEGTYRREDYPQSQGVNEEFTRLHHRTDHRLTAEARFEFGVLEYLSVTWGYLYESQDSRRIEREYGRHGISGGFTFSY